jgi:hypothetical protein
MNNSLGQSPCLVAAKLVAAVDCMNMDYYLAPLSNDTIAYGNSVNPVGCLCNIPIYSLFAACVFCQRHGGWVFDWGFWTKNCSKTFPAYEGKVPPDTKIPPWAILNVEVSRYFTSAVSPLKLYAG